MTACSDPGLDSELVDYRRQSCVGWQRICVEGDGVLDDAGIQRRLGAAIREHRTKAGLTQAVLAERAGIHRTYLNQVEHGHKAATAVVLVHLARAMNTKPSALLQGIA